MPKFRVGYHYTEYGVVTVNALNKGSAELLVNELLDDNGTEFDFTNPNIIHNETTDREFNTQDAEKVDG
jgi:hypothetical protein